jgi:membrane protease YdiL (CAAX protease family)
MESNVDMRKPIASAMHTIGLVLINVCLALQGASMTDERRANASSHLFLFYSVAIIFDWIMLTYVVWGVRRHGGSLRGLIGGSWKHGMDFWRDFLIAAGFWIVSIIGLAVLAMALHIDRSIQNVRFLTPHDTVQLIFFMLLAATAGFCEEIVFRGYLQRQFIVMSGNVPLGILLSAAVFGGAHMYQGAKKTIVLGVYGAMFGTLAYFRRSLRPGMMAHAWQDALAGLALHFLTK